MELEITRFKKLENIEKITLPDGKITLLQGYGGTGKTSIMESIAFVLYDNSDHVQSLFTTAGSHVTLTYRNIKIMRRTNPKRLLVSKDGVTYEDAAGQGIIDGLFGTLFSFELCSYYPQIEIPNKLQSGTAKDRLKFLSELAFPNQEPPYVFIKKVANRLKVFDAEYKVKSDEYERAVSALTLALANKPIRDEWRRPLDDCTVEVNRVREELRRLYEQRGINASRRKDIKIVSEDITRKETDLDKKRTELARLTTVHTARDSNVIDVEATLLEQRGTLTNKVAVLKKQYEHRVQAESQHAQLDRLKSALGDNVGTKITQDDYAVLISTWKQYTASKAIADRLGITYTSDAVNAAIDRYTRSLDYLATKELWTVYDRVCKQLAQYPGDLDTQIENERVRLDHAKRLQSLLRCPKCEAGLRLVGKELVCETDSLATSSTDAVSDVKDIQRTLAGLTEQRDTVIAIKAELSKCNQRIAPARDSDVTDDVLAGDVGKKLKDAKSIIVVPRPELSTEVAKQLLEYSRLKDIVNSSVVDSTVSQESVRDAERELTNLTASLKKVSVEVAQYRAAEKAVAAMTADINRLETDLIAFKSRLERLNGDIIVEVDDHIRTAEEKLRELEATIHGIGYYTEIKAQKRKLDDENKLLVECRARLLGLMGLYKDAVSHQYNGLAPITSRINAVLKRTAPKIFPFPLTVNLSLQKHIKRSGIIDKVKHEVYLTVIYQGIQCDPNKYFSYSLRKRLSLLLAIAVGDIHHSPILMFDELMTNMSSEESETCLVAIREEFENSIVVCAEHKADESNYDNVINL